MASLATVLISYGPLVISSARLVMTSATVVTSSATVVTSSATVVTSLATVVTSSEASSGASAFDVRVGAKSVVKSVLSSNDGSTSVVVVVVGVVVHTCDVNDIVVGSAVVVRGSSVVTSSNFSSGLILDSQMCPIATPSFCAPDHVREQIASFHPSRPN